VHLDGIIVKSPSVLKLNLLSHACSSIFLAALTPCWRR